MAEQAKLQKQHRSWLHSQPQARQSLNLNSQQQQKQQQEWPKPRSNRTPAIATWDSMELEGQCKEREGGELRLKMDRKQHRAGEEKRWALGAGISASAKS